TPASFAPFQAAFDQAVALAQDFRTTASQAQTVIDLLATTEAGLVDAANTTALVTLLDAAQAILNNASEYLSSTIAPLQTAVTAAQAALDAGTIDNAGVLYHSQQILAALGSVELKGNVDVLAALVSFAGSLNQASYTPSTWAVLQTKLTAAQAVLALSEPSQSQVATAEGELIDAVLGLALKANKAGLNTAIALAQQIVANIADYVPASVIGLPAALDSATVVFNDGDATQAQVSAAEQALLAKIVLARLRVPTPAPAPIVLAAQSFQEAPAAAVVAPAKASVKGKAVVGQRLTAKVSVATGAKVSYQWYRGSAKVKGATKATYRVKSVDAGKRLSVKVVAKSAGQVKQTVRSAKTAKVKR
ncbi:MAG: FIVAR domain-containing protein, partial [Bifidobacteriaceae bacterium]|nr:FIVAR domain-containing protein [Bifidobacteriaceae bacterium]